MFSVHPAFLSKSPSSKKAIGKLPDIAEEKFLHRSVTMNLSGVAFNINSRHLLRLEDLCQSVEEVYSPGVQGSKSSPTALSTVVSNLSLARPLLVTMLMRRNRAPRIAPYTGTMLSCAA